MNGQIRILNKNQFYVHSSHFAVTLSQLDDKANRLYDHYGDTH